MPGNTTILSGDIGTVGVNTDNCYHVILMLYHSMACRLDGLTITGGNANGTSTITVIQQNKGGGLYNLRSPANITNVVFQGNLSTSSGGGMYNLIAGPTSFSNVIFSENLALFGGGIYNQDCPSVNLSNVVFSNNTANTGGGGMSNFYTTTNLFNTVFSKNITLNSLGEGAGIYNFQSSMTMKNSILSGNLLSASSTATRSDISNNNSTNTISYTSMQLANNTTNYPASFFPNIGTSNNIFAQNPLFINDADPDGADNIFMTADDGLSIQSASPCKDAGTATGASLIDITGAVRVGNVDMGAYEFRNITTCPTFLNSIAYVNTNATGANTGVNWANAFTSLESALSAARTCPITQIWVAQGTYKPSAYPTVITGTPTLTNRDYTFELVDGVGIYGGFVGTETALTQRMPGNTTILSGDIGTVGVNTDNCYHVILSVAHSMVCRLDGLTITGGYADDPSEISGISREEGGGLHNQDSSPNMKNVIFYKNYSHKGGGMFNRRGNSTNFENVVFLENSSSTLGGGLSNDHSSSVNLSNVIFSNNTTANLGGGIYNNYSSINIINSVFSKNKVLTYTQSGGAIWGFNSTVVMKNCILRDNESSGSLTNPRTDLAYIESTTTYTISNTSMQLANNTTNYPTANFPNIGTSNNIFAQNPLFVNDTDPDGADNIFMTADDGVSIQSVSPCKDAGTATGASLTDITGAARVGNVDMGAYEFQSVVSCTPPTGTTAGSNSPVLVGGTINLTSSSTGGTSQVWAGPSGYSSTAQNPSIASATLAMAGDYTVTIISSGTCTATATVNVVINPAPTVCSPPTGVTAGSNSPVLVGSPINLTSSSTGGTSQTWAGPSGFNSTAQNPSIASATLAMAGDYTVTITSSGTCTATATVNVVINPAPTVCSPPTGVTAGSNSPVFVGGTINLTSSSTGGTSQVWAGPSGFNSTAQNPNIASATLAMAGDYTVTITSSGTCTAMATVNVVVNPLPTGAVVFVNVAIVSPTQDGNSWATAYSNLQTALSTAPANSEFWVAQGTYKPTTSKTQTISFNIPNGAMLFGGFVGTEGAQNQRNFRNNPTILSGEIGSISTVSDNSYHVVTFDGANNTTRLDGFTITGGNASLVADRVRSSPSSAILPVSINDGGGIALDNGSSPMIINCKIINNDGIVGGGLFATNASNPTVMNCVFMGNQATFGGGVYHLGSNPSYNNVLFAGNKATGGAVYNNGSNPTLTNVTIAGNGGLNGAIFNSVSTPVVKNSIIYGNIMPFNDTQSVVTYSIVEGGFSGVGNLNLNPQFVDLTPYGLTPNTSGDYQLTNTSPAIDAGDNGTITLTDKDLIGNLRRFNGGIVDMGAYEFQGSRVGGTIISITSGNWENGSTWNGGVSPLAGDNVIINNNHNVTILNQGTAKNVEIRTNAKIIHSTASSKLQTGF